jgi:hypothetical protein
MGQMAEIARARAGDFARGEGFGGGGGGGRADARRDADAGDEGGDGREAAAAAPQWPGPFATARHLYATRADAEARRAQEEGERAGGDGDDDAGDEAVGAVVDPADPAWDPSSLRLSALRPEWEPKTAAAQDAAGDAGSMEDDGMGVGDGAPSGAGARGRAVGAARKRTMIAVAGPSGVRMDVPPLATLCMEALVGHLHAIALPLEGGEGGEEGGGLTALLPNVRASFCAAVCRARAMDAHAFRLFAAACADELVVPDCAGGEWCALFARFRDAPAWRDAHRCWRSLHYHLPPPPLLLRTLAHRRAVDAATMAACLSTASGMTRLALGHCGRGFTDATVEALVQSGVAGGLQHVELSGAYVLTEAGLEALLRAATGLRTLHLTACSLLTGRFVALLPSLTPQLSSLALAGMTWVGDAGLCGQVAAAAAAAAPPVRGPAPRASPSAASPSGGGRGFPRGGWRGRGRGGSKRPPAAKRPRKAAASSDEEGGPGGGGAGDSDDAALAIAVAASLDEAGAGGGGGGGGGCDSDVEMVEGPSPPRAQVAAAHAAPAAAPSVPSSDAAQPPPPLEPAADELPAGGAFDLAHLASLRLGQVEGAALSGRMLRALVRAHGARLTELALDRVACVNDAVLQEVGAHCTALTSLTLSGCGDGVTDVGVCAVAATVKPATGTRGGLTTLALERCRGVSPRGVAALVLVSGTTLRSLSLAGTVSGWAGNGWAGLGGGIVCAVLLTPHWLAQMSPVRACQCVVGFPGVRARSAWHTGLSSARQPAVVAITHHPECLHGASVVGSPCAAITTSVHAISVARMPRAPTCCCRTAMRPPDLSTPLGCAAAQGGA